MIGVKDLTNDELGLITAFEKTSGVMPTDYFQAEGAFYFLVSPSDLGKAIGKQGAMIKKLTAVFKKKVIIIKDSDELGPFVRNFFSNLQLLDVDIRDVMGERDVALVVEEKDRGLAIGKNGERIKTCKEFLKGKFKATISVHTRRAVI